MPKEDNIFSSQNSEYFTSDKIRSINEISDDDMVTNLRAFEGSVFWPCLLKYIFSRSSAVSNSLKTLDPVKNPTEISRNQGMLLGFSDIIDAILILSREKSEN